LERISIARDSKLYAIAVLDFDNRCKIDIFGFEGNNFKSALGVNSNSGVSTYE